MKKQVAIVQEDPNHSTTTFVDWTLGNVCNYECTYCPSRLHDGSLPWPAVEVVIQTAEAIIQHYKTLGRTAYFKFSGGEPSAYKGMRDVLRRVKQLGAATALNSNGSRELAWWDAVIPFLDSMVLTYHLEFARLDHFAAVLNRLTQAGIPTHVNVTMLPERFDECFANASELAVRCQGMSLSLKALRVGFGNELYPYSEDQKRRMAGFEVSSSNMVRGHVRCVYDDGTFELLAPQDFILRDANRWTSWRCNAGIESLAIRSDGQVYRAVCKQGGAIGNLRMQSIAFPASAVQCTKNDCHCLSDIKITKWRAAENA